VDKRNYLKISYQSAKHFVHLINNVLFSHQNQTANNQSDGRHGCSLQLSTEFWDLFPMYPYCCCGRFFAGRRPSAEFEFRRRCFL
jgi:hypothetical protein